MKATSCGFGNINHWEWTRKDYSTQVPFDLRPEEKKRLKDREGKRRLLTWGRGKRWFQETRPSLESSDSWRKVQGISDGISDLKKKKRPFKNGWIELLVTFLGAGDARDAEAESSLESTTSPCLRNKGRNKYMNRGWTQWALRSVLMRLTFI